MIFGANGFVVNFSAKVINFLHIGVFFPRKFFEMSGEFKMLEAPKHKEKILDLLLYLKIPDTLLLV